jgi:large subunit ribosomal protein L18
MAKTNPSAVARKKRIRRIRKKIIGTPARPRLRVFKSINHIYAQVIDDSKGHTLAAVSSLQEDIRNEGIKGKCNRAKRVGLLLAEKAKAAGVETVVFDRGGYIYHGRLKALSEGAREGGLKF